MFFRKAHLIDPDLKDWIIDNFDWVDQNRPQWAEMSDLILPTKAFFSAGTGTDPETARAVVADIQRHLGLTQPIRVEPQSENHEMLRHEYGKLGETAGQYFHDENDPLITYLPSNMERPIVFINTMAHELIHARLADVIDDLPGGEPAHELATDLHCIIAGFGLFQLQAAEDMGWAGYMSQPARAVALAEFLKRKEIPVDQALDRLTGRPRKWLKKALAA